MTKSKKKKNKPLREIQASQASSPTMAKSKAKAVAEEKERADQAEADREAAEAERAEAEAKAKKLSAELAQAKKMLACQSGRVGPGFEREKASFHGSASTNGSNNSEVSRVQALLKYKRKFGRSKKSNDDDEVFVDEMVTRINTAVKHDSFNTRKYVLGPNGKKNLGNQVLDYLQMDGYYGPGPRIQKNRAEWIEYYQDDCVQALNSVRNTVSSEIKKAARVYYKKNNSTLPTKGEMNACLARQLEVDDALMYKHFEFFCMEIIPKATGSAQHWNKAKREYLPLSTAAPRNAPNKPYITPETEAYSMIVYVGNRTRWIKQFEVADGVCGEQYKGKIQRLLGPAKNANGEEIEDAEDEVSLFFIFACQNVNI